MKQIPLTQGCVALVDDEDYPVLSRMKWSLSTEGYAVHSLRIGGRAITLYMHRLLLVPRPREVIDHVNGNRTDNRKGNIRIASRTENGQNSLRAKGIVGLKGVSPSGNRFVATIDREGVSVHIGSFATALDAAAAYDAMARKLYGPRAATNERIFQGYLKRLRELKK